MVPTEVGSEQIVDAMSLVLGVMKEVWGEGGSPYREFYKKAAQIIGIAWNPKRYLDISSTAYRRADSGF
jgi:hypothetical protein